MLIKSHLLTLAIGVASIATALTPANARGGGGGAAHAGGMAVHTSAPAPGRTQLGSAIMRVPAQQAKKIGAIPSVGPRGIMVRTKVGQLPSNVTPSNVTTASGGSLFGQALQKANAVAAAAPTTTSGSLFGQALQKANAVAAAAPTTISGSLFGQALQKYKDATAAATSERLAHGPDKLKLPGGALDKPPLGPIPGGGPGHGVDKLKLPAGTLGDKTQIPATKGSDTGSNPSTHPTSPSHSPMGGGYGGGGVVAAPVDGPGVTVADSAAAAVVGQQVVQQNPACGPTRIPRLAAALDELLPTAQLAAADLEAVKALRIAIADLAAAGKYMPARAVEEQAMSMLGYGKLWVRCGDGSFTWTKQVAAAQ